MADAAASHTSTRPAAPPWPAGARGQGLAQWLGAGQWRTRHVAALACTDALVVTVALAVAFFARFGGYSAREVTDANGVSYLVVATVTAAVWLAALAGSGGYEVRLLGVGAEEYKRVAAGTFRAGGILAIVCYALKAEVARGFVVLALPLGLLLLLASRGLSRRRLVAGRRRGRSLHRVVVVGDRRSVVALAGQLRRERAAGFHVVGACLPTASARLRELDQIPVLGSHDDVATVVRAHGADTVAVASPHVSSEAVRRIAWSLEGSGVDLVVAPAVVDVAGPRVSVRPVAGLPLLHVDEPEFTGFRRLAKNALDRALAAAALLLLSPVLLLVAVLVRRDSPGPALFWQTRIGRAGREFRVVKFRTMYADAEHRLAELRAANETDGLLFKIRQDPRVTRTGRFLRRSSIDELPQLVNVLRGEMSLVGPRPLPVQDADFAGDVRRRLLVRPGITGLWQVNGRSELAWEDAVRLDLYYVENWSISLDLAILWRTVGTVVRGTGAC